MGILYREVVEYKYHKFLRHILFVAIVVMAIDIIYLVSDFRKLIEELVYVGYGLMPVIIFSTFLMVVKCKRRYRYVIIDNELIIEKLNGNKRKPILNINVKQIIKIEKLRNIDQNDSVERSYNFACSFSKSNRYRCVFSRDGKLYSFDFEPSTNLIGKIDGILSRRIIA